MNDVEVSTRVSRDEGIIVMEVVDGYASSRTEIAWSEYASALDGGLAHALALAADRESGDVLVMALVNESPIHLDGETVDPVVAAEAAGLSDRAVRLRSPSP